MLRKLGLFCLSLLILLLSAGLSTAQGAEDGALVRVVMPAPDAAVHEILVDGAVMATVASDSVAVYVSIPPGEHEFTLVPQNKTTTESPTRPITLDLETGDQHFIYAIWETTAKRRLAIHDVDEKAIIGDADGDDGDDGDDGAFVYIHTILGAPPVDVIEDGKKVISDLAYGDYATFSGPAANVDASVITVAGDPDTQLFDPGPYFLEPNTLWVAMMVGKYPGTMWEDYTYYYYDPLVDANASDYLASFSEANVGPTNFGADYPYRTDIWTFDTFLDAVDAAGLSDLLSGDEAITVFAPTDAAFDRLPDGALDALMANPELLKQVVENHIVEGAAANSSDELDTPLTTMDGGELTLSYSDDGVFQINGANHGCECSYNVSNGRVYLIDDVLLPDGLDLTVTPEAIIPTAEPTLTPEATTAPTAEATASAGTATVVLYNATWMDSIDLYVDGSAVFSGDSRGALSQRFDVAAGSHLLEITYSGDSPSSAQLRLAEGTIEPNRFYLVLASGFNYIEGTLDLFDLGPVPQPGETLPGQVLLVNKLIGIDGLTLAFDRSPLIENVTPFTYGLADAASNKYQRWQMLDSATGDELIHGAAFVGDPALTLPNNSVELFMIEGEYPGVDGDDYQWWWLSIPTGAITQTDGGPIAVGDSLDVELVRGERAGFTLTLDSAAQVNVLLTGATTDQDSYLRIFDADGNLFYENDELSGADVGYNAGLYRITLDPGTYTVEVASWNDNEPGSYTLSIEDAGPIPTEEPVEPNATPEAA